MNENKISDCFYFDNIIYSDIKNAYLPSSTINNFSLNELVNISKFIFSAGQCFW